MEFMETEYTSSTPGISQSLDSRRLLISSSTSWARAPGIMTITFAAGTTIWGFSSRGVKTSANNPRIAVAAMSSTVSWELMKYWVILPLMLSFILLS